MTSYPEDSLDNHPDAPDNYPPEDDGTMPANVTSLGEHLIGRRIIKAEPGSVRVGDLRMVSDGYESEYEKKHYPDRQRNGFILTLDDGRRVLLADTSDCCAHTYLEKFLLHPERIDHAITGVASTNGYTKWHIFADLGDILELDVEWSPGNPFYYGYGFDIYVSEVLDSYVITGELEP
ncbi:DUF7448 domain-containing protein [Gordonia rubripertincta]|uniref:DUF7448 domain-containing protein n=1 Tax=Gordonia rubripertincta TaxID=36822 RepID=UPI0015FCE2F0|nr:hypothetical protein [Gordonia rubripertincta]QMU19338.1 hypothetical protein H3V45_14690 [Gordonia rubripertincta]